VTGGDGGYRFLALPPGVYSVDFDLTGFNSVKRSDVRVVINQTLTVDMQLQVATLQETVTVTGASPIVDTSTTAMGTNFTKELLTEIPNARDVWAAMAQAPGIQMTGFDVGGSNTGNQTGFRSYGFDTQNQTRVEGIDTTEGTAANAGARRGMPPSLMGRNIAHLQKEGSPSNCLFYETAEDQGVLDRARVVILPDAVLRKARPGIQPKRRRV
jgi:hypothetical protein